MQDCLDFGQDFGGGVGCEGIVFEGGDLEEGEALDFCELLVF